MSRNASPPAVFVDRRAAERKPTALLAFAQHRDGSRYPCQVKNISDRGAMLEFLGSQAVQLEDVFDLVLASADMRYAVQLVWRRERMVGVLFCGDAA
ncbi:PilZ domain-containing protein [Methylobacterium oryzae]|uniref:Pilus assembly protein PilZ n=1 Tax=Methylobacterium oryzae TaxID=334852 RepID=A0ABU7TP97_9HYPH